MSFVINVILQGALGINGGGGRLLLGAANQPSWQIESMFSCPHVHVLDYVVTCTS